MSVVFVRHGHLPVVRTVQLHLQAVHLLLIRPFDIVKACIAQKLHAFALLDDLRRGVQHCESST